METDLSRMYFAFQEDGMLFEVQRIDGQPFNAKTVNLKNHKNEGSQSSSSRRDSREKRRLHHRWPGKVQFLVFFGRLQGHKSSVANEEGYMSGGGTTALTTFVEFIETA